MRLSEERVAIIATDICETLLNEELVDLEIDEDRFRFLVENLILGDLMVEDEIDEEATEWLQVNKPYLQDGTSEWEIELEHQKEAVAERRGYVIR